ncbi:hypothetical protein G9A89_008458 [Geosiphon pyriformis]|nr:hypothetical protein G9A89_008458 [Geosiphon pyriformis]
MYVRDRCAIICFADKASKLAAISLVPIFKGVSLHWAGLSLACCATYKHFGHVSNMCSMGGNSGRYGRRVITPQNQTHLVDIYKKRQAPITHPVSFGGKTWAQVVGRFFSHVVFFVVSGAKSFLDVKSLSMDFNSFMVTGLNDHLVFLEHSLELLADQVSGILKRLSSAELVPLFLASLTSPLVVFASLDLSANSNMVLDAPQVFSSPSITVIDNAASNLGSSSSKILTTKVGGLESKMMALDVTVVFTSGLDSSYLGAGVVIVINSSLTRHVCKISKVPGQLLSIKLLFKNKLSVSILGLYAGASLVVWFFQAGKVNSLIIKAVNESSFVVLGGDFNEDGATLANATMFSDEFATSVKFSDLDAIWNIVHKIMILLASEVFKRKWFKSFDYVFTKESLRFYKLKLLVSKIVKVSCEECVANFESLMEHWVSLDNDRALFVQGVMDFGANTNGVYSAFFSTKRSYRTSKLTESLRAKKANIRSAIDKRMESFEMDKGHMIRSVLEQSFCKVVLDHLVVGNELVFEPNLVKFKVDNIIEGWTRKRVVVDNVSDTWSRQYQLLDYIFDKVFPEVMCVIDFDKLHHVVSNLPIGKATGLSGIFNDLWKHCDQSVLDLLLVLLNSCLSCELVPGPWKEAWVSMIPKPYKWEGVLMNTCPIALIETACKILFKILSDRISFACSSHDVLHGNNFSVLKDMITQSSIFAIGSVIEDSLEKN